MASPRQSQRLCSDAAGTVENSQHAGGQFPLDERTEDARLEFNRSVPVLKHQVIAICEVVVEPGCRIAHREILFPARPGLVTEDVPSKSLKFSLDNRAHSVNT